jgi:hypothetical protein
MPETTELSDYSLFALSIPYQCSQKWRLMDGDDQVRHCGSCKQNVYNISTMTRKEAVDLINEKEGDLCVRFYQRRDGTIITKDCSSILGRDQVKQKWSILAMINAGLAFFATVLMPMLGPAVVTIRQGGMAPMMDTSYRGSGSHLSGDDLLPETAESTPPIEARKSRLDGFVSEMNRRMNALIVKHAGK